jgi:Uma2 family endonuclease
MSAQQTIPTSYTLAPWAEIVPGVGSVTVDALLTMSDDGWRYEVVEGVLVRVAGSGLWATTIGRRLAGRLGDFVEDHDLGAVSGADGVYKFPGAETGLLPDAGFINAAHRALVPDINKPVPFAPDLAAEIASPSQRPADMAAKAQLYLRGGTRLVWVVWPEQQAVDVWRPDDLRPDANAMRPSATLGAGDTLDGEDVVPGFSAALARLLRHP